MSVANGAEVSSEDIEGNANSKAGLMQITPCELNHVALQHAGHTISDNQSELTRERAWEERMAALEAIHVEILPQLEALRAFDEDYILGFEQV